MFIGYAGQPEKNLYFMIMLFPGSVPDKYIALGRKPQVPAGFIYSHHDEVFNLVGILLTGMR